MATVKCIQGFLCMLVCLITSIVLARERVYYADFERPNVTYWNPKYYEYMSVIARRYSRIDPMHYVTLHYKTRVPFGNNVSIDVYIYEFLSNEYRRSFVEMHYKACDFIIKDKIFGTVFAARIPEVFKKCPFPQAEYHLANLSYPDIPLLKTFPFQKGRVFVNFSIPKIKERIVETYIDLLIKSRWR